MPTPNGKRAAPKAPPPGATNRAARRFAARAEAEQGNAPRAERARPRAAKAAERDAPPARAARPARPERGPRKESDRDAAPRATTRPAARPARAGMPGRPGLPVQARADAPAPTGRRNNPAGRPERRPERQPERVPAAVAAETHEPQRIARLLARAGVASRRDIERMISEGRIALNGEVITTPATIVKSLAGITVNGLTITAMEPTRLFRFHKPGGVLTTSRDPGGRPTIFDILPPGLPRTVPVGRLDMNTEGLLLLTTDGALKRALELPSSSVPRSYRVRAYGEIHQRVLEDLIDGITVEGVQYGPIDAGIERRTGRNLWIGMTLTEGKNREIRRVLEHLGLQVSRLIRTRYGPIHLEDLPPRGVDEVPPQLVAQLLNVLKRGPDAS
ncbi:pseudouridine synthase [Polymorphobacter sp.]|uniref:pseudouridine synthase n=1 Tax=Polymorphobacter sp. TaxID=1909290 RepID=UPI003F724801